MRRLVRRTFGHISQGRRDFQEQLRERQLDAQLAQLGKVEVKRGHRLHLQSHGQNVGRNEGIAVTVAADPTADAEKDRQLPIFIRKTRNQQILHLRVKTRQLGKKRILVVADAILDFIHHGQTVRTQHTRMPHAQHGTAQGLIVVRLLVGR